MANGALLLGIFAIVVLIIGGYLYYKHQKLDWVVLVIGGLMLIGAIIWAVINLNKPSAKKSCNVLPETNPCNLSAIIPVSYGQNPLFVQKCDPILKNTIIQPNCPSPSQNCTPTNCTLPKIDITQPTQNTILFSDSGM